MTSLALLNEFIGLPPNASEHGYQIDHIIEFCHWFMGALFLGWSAYFVYVLLRFRKGRHPVADHEGVDVAAIPGRRLVVDHSSNRGRLIGCGERDAAAIVERITPLLQPNDIVTIFSNGGFDGIHEKLLAKLAAL